MLQKSVKSMRKAMTKFSSNLSKGIGKSSTKLNKGMSKSVPKGVQNTENLFMKPFKGMGEDLFAGKMYWGKKGKK